jgi:hypothetical protein
MSLVAVGLIAPRQSTSTPTFPGARTCRGAAGACISLLVRAQWLAAARMGQHQSLLERSTQLILSRRRMAAAQSPHAGCCVCARSRWRMLLHSALCARVRAAAAWLLENPGALHPLP